MSDDSAARLREIRQDRDELNAPCVFCGYAGEGYWQAGTHPESCPWHKLGGDYVRRVMLRDAIKALTRERDEAIRAQSALRAKGIDVQVLVDAYDWTFNYETGEIAGLTAGDHGFEDTGIVVPEIAKLQIECDQFKAQAEAARATLARVEQERDAAQAWAREQSMEEREVRATLARVQGLIEQWRGQGGHEALVAIQCADELEQALSNPLPAPQETP